MARWQLTEPHYLNVPGNKWELEIKNRTNGRSERKQFPVPLHLDPNIESDWNYVDKLGNNIIDGKIVVCWQDKGEEKDIIFFGPPTPGMLPLDDEARKESAKYSWTPTQGLDDISQSNSFNTQLLIKFTEDLRGISTQSPQVEGMADFMKTMSEMMKMQTEILATLAGKKVEAPLAPAPTQEQELARIADELELEPTIDDLPPLPPAPKRPRR